MHPIFERHVDALRNSGQSVEVRPLASGAVLLTIRDVPLPAGWNKPLTSVRFVAPAGYPFAAPDCFWADPDLALASGLAPQASNNQPEPESGDPGTWFSWHVGQWNPNSDSLLTFFRLIKRRLQTVQ